MFGSTDVSCAGIGRRCLAEGLTEGDVPKGISLQVIRRKSDVEDNGHESRASTTLVTVQTTSSWTVSRWQRHLARRRKVAARSQKAQASKRSPLARRCATRDEQYNASVASLGFPGFLGKPCTLAWTCM